MSLLTNINDVLKASGNINTSPGCSMQNRARFNLERLIPHLIGLTVLNVDCIGLDLDWLTMP